jgi:hypothetical protein
MHAGIFFQFCDNIKNLAKTFTPEIFFRSKCPRNFRKIGKFYCKNSFEICQEIFLWGWTQMQNLVL